MKPEITILTKDSLTIDGIVYELKEIYVGSESQIPEPEETWLNGSACFPMDTQEVRTLNKGAWV